MRHQGGEAARFVAAFNRVLEADPEVAPGPTALNRELGKPGTPRTPLNILNGRMVTLRRRLLTEAGFVQDHHGERWHRP